MEQIDFDKLISQENLLKELEITVQALNHRIRQIKKRGFYIIKFSDMKKNISYYPEDAQLLRDYKIVYPKNRKEIKGNRAGIGGFPTHKKKID